MMTFKLGNRLRSMAVSSALVLWASASFAVTMAVDSANVNPGDSARICVRLGAGSDKVAGTQNDLFWDSSCLQLMGKCAANPLHGKQLSSKETASSMRAIVISFGDVDPIPDGELYCCNFTVLDSRQSDCCAVNIQGASTSDPKGKAITVNAQGGKVCSSRSSGGSSGGPVGGVAPMAPVVANPNAAAGGTAPSAGGPQAYSGGGPAGAPGAAGGGAPVVVSGGGVASGGGVVAPPQVVAPQVAAPQAAAPQGGVPQVAAPAAPGVVPPAGSVPAIAGGTPAIVATPAGALVATVPAAAPTLAPTKPAPTSKRAATPTEKVEKSSGCQVGQSNGGSWATILLMVGAVILWGRRTRTAAPLKVRSSTSEIRVGPGRR